MRKALAALLFAAASFAASLGFCLEAGGGWAGVFPLQSDRLSYVGSYPEREFASPQSFFSLEGGEAFLSASLRWGVLSAGAVAVLVDYSPDSSASRFEVRNDAVGVTLSLPAVSLSGWRAGIRVKAALPLVSWDFNLFASASYYFIHSLRSGDYADDGKIYVVEAPVRNYVFRFVGEDYNNQEVKGLPSFGASLGAEGRLFGRKEGWSLWLAVEASCESLGWKFLYYEAENYFVSARVYLSLRR